MNNIKAREIIDTYKNNFTAINQEEIYKWRAIKVFKDHWNIDALNFEEMLSKAFASSANLLDSGQYFPKRMLTQYSNWEPEKVRSLFKHLYNDENDNVIERIIEFQAGINNIHNAYLPDKKSYQDDRAVIVYLCLMYPEIYYLYKYRMFKEFAAMVDYPYKPKKGAKENFTHYTVLCEILKSEIIRDEELLKLHKIRIKEREYNDFEYNVLTQDVIYAAVKHFSKFITKSKKGNAHERLKKVDNPIIPKSQEVILRGSFPNYVEKLKNQKRVGDLGEILVMQYENEKLKQKGLNKLAKHIAKAEGDGLGYDILSYNEKGEEVMIEVKTTSGNSNAPFYITANELVCSKINKSKYYLYRLFEYDEINNTAKFYIHHGDLTELCITPILYKVNV